jgi:hypothetical protein
LEEEEEVLKTACSKWQKKTSSEALDEVLQEMMEIDRVA